MSGFWPCSTNLGRKNTTFYDSKVSVKDGSKRPEKCMPWKIYGDFILSL